MGKLNVIISALGSHGDIHPFIAIAKTLRNRGHRVAIIAPEQFGELIGKLNFEFVPVATQELMDRIGNDPDLWHPTRAVQLVSQATVELLPAYYFAIQRLYVPGKTVSVISSLAMAGKIAQEKLGIPTVSVHLSPMVIRSVAESADMGPVPIAEWQPMWLKRLMFELIDEVILDRWFAPGVNDFRAALGLGPARRILGDWLHSPDRVIGLFPEWFAPYAPDWPPQLRLTGFPLYDEADVAPLDENLRRFLDTAEKPIAFTPGSAMRHAREYFESAVKICRQLGKRGLLVSRFEENFPPDLPKEILAVRYAPFSQLLPGCTAVVHHGGIGTSAQSLAAGVPQLVMPMSHDQPDNAARLVKLGVARALPARKFTPARAAVVLNELLISAEVRENANKYCQKLKRSRAMEETAELIEAAVI